MARVLPLGHVGITTGIVHALDRRADLRLVTVVALLPDLVDKPIRFLLPSIANGWTRNVGHSLASLTFFTAVVLAVRRKRAWPLVLAYALHFVLDRMWEPGNYTVLFWPFSGFFLPRHFPESLEIHVFEDLWDLAGEVLGLLIALVLVSRGRLWRPERLKAFLRTGVLGTPSAESSSQGSTAVSG